MPIETATSSADSVWDEIRQRAFEQASREPMLASFLYATILNHRSLEDALSFHLANKLDSPALAAISVREVIDQALARSEEHTSELQSRPHLVCRLLLEKKKK